MRKDYAAPSAAVCKLEYKDVICTSGEGAHAFDIEWVTQQDEFNGGIGL